MRLMIGRKPLPFFELNFEINEYQEINDRVMNFSILFSLRLTMKIVALMYANV
jgi:hypothetical protein